MKTYFLKTTLFIAFITIIINCEKQYQNDGRNMAIAKIIGIYPITADEPVHLVELMITDSIGIFDIGEFTQEIINEPKENWQAPYMEYILNNEGDSILADDLEAPHRPELWKGNFRIVFFFHYLDINRHLKSPFGDLKLPNESKLPKRLNIIEYDPPD